MAGIGAIDDAEIDEALKDVKIGSKEEKRWTELLEKEEENLLSHKMNVEITEVMMKHAKKRIEEEKQKFK